MLNILVDSREPCGTPDGELLLLRLLLTFWLLLTLWLFAKMFVVLLATTEWLFEAVWFWSVVGVFFAYLQIGCRVVSSQLAHFVGRSAGFLQAMVW